MVGFLARNDKKMDRKTYYVYILTNFKNTVFYTGVTGDLIKRIWQHKNILIDGFTKKYHIWKLVYYETYEDPENAILREKQIKKWRREKKLWLIKKENPNFLELKIV